MPKQVVDSVEDRLTPPITDPADVDPRGSKDRPKGTSLDAVLALRKRGFSLAECGRQLNVSKQAIGQLLRRSGVDVEAVEQYKRDKPFLLNAVQKKVLDSIDSKVIQKMSGRDRFIAVGICEDKIASLERCGPNVINNWLAIVQQSQVRTEKVIEVQSEEVTNE